MWATGGNWGDAVKYSMKLNKWNRDLEKVVIVLNKKVKFKFV